MRKDYRRSEPETVLILNGGGSLGAYECGVYKTLVRHGLKFDIIAGTSIGAVNAAILASAGAGSEQKDDHVNSAKILESFWLNMADDVTPSFLPYKMRSSIAATHTLLYGNPKAFVPLWNMPAGIPFYNSYNSPYLYTTIQLRNTLNKYVDFTKLKRKVRFTDTGDNANRDIDKDNENIQDNKKGNIASRLILVCTDIQRGEPVIFDSNQMDITAEHVVACTGYPFYGISWTKIDDRYLWDGSLLSNTPLRDVIDASSKREKRVYISEIFPRKQEKLPNNMSETWHRARDIMFVDKSTHRVVEHSETLKRYIVTMEEMYDIIRSSRLDEKEKARFKELEPEYKNLLHLRGAVIDEIISIKRKERSGGHYLLEDADFSVASIKELIRQGEEDAEDAIANKNQETLKKSHQSQR